MKKRDIVIFIVFVIAIFIGTSLLFNSNKKTQTTVFALDTVIDIRLTGKDAEKAEQEIIDCINNFENKASMYKEGSDVYRINENAGKGYVNIDDRTFELLKKALDYCGRIESDKFDITVAPLVKLWNITGDNPKVPVVTDEVLSLVNYKDVLLKEDTNEVMLKKSGQGIDLGGVAKGAVSDDVMEILKKNKIKEAVISLGGNVIVYGDKSYNVGIKHPRKPDEIICIVKAKNKIISTTGDYERYFEIDGKRYHHIFDPKTGFPYESEFYSVTVLNEDGTFADYLSTAFFAGNKDDVFKLMSGYDIIAVGKDNKIHISDNLDVEPVDQDFTVVKH